MFGADMEIIAETAFVLSDPDGVLVVGEVAAAEEECFDHLVLVVEFEGREMLLEVFIHNHVNGLAIPLESHVF
jgi:hypothetical protein